MTESNDLTEEQTKLFNILQLIISSDSCDVLKDEKNLKVAEELSDKLDSFLSGGVS